MRLLQTGTVALLALATLAAAVAASDDPWIVPVPQGPELLLTLESSKRSYLIDGVEKPAAEAAGPAHVKLDVPAKDAEAIAAARKAVDAGQGADALVQIDVFLREHPENWDAHAVRAAALHATGAHAEAAAALRTSLIGNRRNPDAWKLLESVAKALSKKVVRPQLDVRGWVAEGKDGAVTVGSVFVKEGDFPWTYYACARAVYRYEGRFASDFADAKTYRFTFREQMFAMNVLAAEAENQRKSGKTNPAELKTVLAERKAGTLTEFTFFAVYPEAVPAKPEPGFDALRPRLEAYFDEKILRK